MLIACERESFPPPVERWRTRQTPAKFIRNVGSALLYGSIMKQRGYRIAQARKREPVVIQGAANAQGGERAAVDDFFHVDFDAHLRNTGDDADLR